MMTERGWVEDQEVDDTARLVLMELEDNNNIGLRPFFLRMREELGHLELEVMVKCYKKYMGFDGRTLATHNYKTGRRFGR